MDVKGLVERFTKLGIRVPLVISNDRDALHVLHQDLSCSWFVCPECIKRDKDPVHPRRHAIRFNGVLHCTMCTGELVGTLAERILEHCNGMRFTWGEHALQIRALKTPHVYALNTTCTCSGRQVTSNKILPGKSRAFLALAFFCEQHYNDLKRVVP